MLAMSLYSKHEPAEVIFSEVMFFLCNHSNGGWVGKKVKGDCSNFSQNSPLLIYSHRNSVLIFLSSSFYLKLVYKKELLPFYPRI